MSKFLSNPKITYKTIDQCIKELKVQLVKEKKYLEIIKDDVLFQDTVLECLAVIKSIEKNLMEYGVAI